MTPSTLGLVVATHQHPEWMQCVSSWVDLASSSLDMEIILSLDIVRAYNEGWRESQSPILGFIHDDLLCYGQAWDYRILTQFQDSRVGMVGVAGALRHGSPELYVAPYDFRQLGRQHFLSNLRNAEDHGSRFTGECDVAVLDGMALFVRRSILEAAGGFHRDAGYWMYSEALCCEARRQGYRIRLVGLDVDHLGGRTASMVQVKDDHAKAHEWLFDEYRDCLPFCTVEGL